MLVAMAVATTASAMMTTVTAVATMTTTTTMTTVVAAEVAATTKTTVATVMAKSIENNQINVVTAMEMVVATETATVTVMMAAVMQQQWHRLQQRRHIAGVICLMMCFWMQYFGWGGDWQGHAASHFPAAHISLEVNRHTFGWGW
jgi:hypothetical protein